MKSRNCQVVTFPQLSGTGQRRIPSAGVILALMASQEALLSRLQLWRGVASLHVLNPRSGLNPSWFLSPAHLITYVCLVPSLVLVLPKGKIIKNRRAAISGTVWSWKPDCVDIGIKKWETLERWQIETQKSWHWGCDGRFPIQPRNSMCLSCTALHSKDIS